MISSDRRPDPVSQRNGHNGAVDDDEIDLREIWNILARNRFLIAGCMLLVASLAAAYAFLADPVYEAAASIRIDEGRSRGTTTEVDPLTLFAGGSGVETEMEVLRSRTIAEHVVDSLGLQLVLTEPTRVPRVDVFAHVDISREAPQATYIASLTDEGRYVIREDSADTIIAQGLPGDRMGLPGAVVSLAPTAAEYDEIRFTIRSFYGAVGTLRGSIAVSRPNADANVVVVGYQNTDPELVGRVPNAIANTFIARRRQVQKTEARSTVGFLNVQIDTLRAQLVTAEEALRAFRERSQVVDLDAQAGAQVNRLAQLEAQRSQLEAERSALAQLLEDIQASAPSSMAPNEASPYRRLMAFPTIFRNQAATQLLSALTTVENERAQLLKQQTFEHPDVVTLTQRIRELETQLQTIATTYLQGLSNQVGSLNVLLARFGRELEAVPATEIEFARLQRQAQLLEEIYVMLETRLREAQIAEAVEDPSVRIIDPAIYPGGPIEPRKPLIIMLGLLVGIVTGVGAAFTREYMDSAVHTREDVQQATGAPVLGMIPRIRNVEQLNGKRIHIMARRNGNTTNGSNGSGVAERHGGQQNSHSAVSEAYRSLRTNIIFSRPEQQPRSLVFTSPMPGEGKSTSAANLAVTLAAQGVRVVLVDADLRRGVLHQVFDVPREPGLSQVLLGLADLETAVRRVRLDEDHGFDLLATGTRPPNPAELLGSARMRELIERLEAEHEAVVLDAPPLNLLTDAALLGSNADGVIVVARAAVTQKGALTYAIEQLRQVRAPVLGSVINDIDVRRDLKYHGGYGAYAYYSLDDSAFRERHK